MILEIVWKLERKISFFFHKKATHGNVSEGEPHTEESFSVLFVDARRTRHHRHRCGHGRRSRGFARLVC